MRVLVVEDDADLADVIARGLRQEALAVDLAFDGDEALVKTASTDYDVVVLDRDLPRVHGDEVCRELASGDNGERILMLTASGTLDDRVAGLQLGADDYLPKPFAMKELVARVRALGRRTASAVPPVLQVADVVLDPGRRSAVRGDRDLNLTRKEFGVLEVLMSAEGQVVSSESLLEKVWDENADPFTNAIRITVMTLRRKLGDPPLIETVVGVGYKLAP
jgi:DNA-binding response OmpR family regulator